MDCLNGSLGLKWSDRLCVGLLTCHMMAFGKTFLGASCVAFVIFRLDFLNQREKSTRNMLRFFSLLLVLMLGVQLPTASAQNKPKPKPKTTRSSAKKPATKPATAKPAAPVVVDPTKEDGLLAVINTTKGEIVCKLYDDKTPLTVMNFVGLAEGTKTSSRGAGVPFFDGLKFHRVIKDFMIQGGDPNSIDADPANDGQGGPGYAFADEFDPSLKHDGPGVLSMANSGPGTNGSQFFITHKETPWLDGKHTVFGRVVKGQDVVNAIQQGDVMNTVRIVRNGAKAQAYKATQEAFDQLVASIVSRQQAAMDQKIRDNQALVAQKFPNAQKKENGILYEIVKPGDGPKITENMEITFHYTATKLSGEKLDSSRDRGQAVTLRLGPTPMVEGVKQVFLDMNKGERRTAVLPWTVMYFGNPEQSVIPKGEYLIYDIEMLDAKPLGN